MNVCDTSAGGGDGDQACDRNLPATPDAPAVERAGTLRFKGELPPVALIGYSFEVHARYGEEYFRADTDDETKLKTHLVPLQFQYGKVGGRCARLAEKTK